MKKYMQNRNATGRISQMGKNQKIKKQAKISFEKFFKKRKLPEILRV